jgi:hypothetical protein
VPCVLHSLSLRVDVLPPYHVVSGMKRVEGRILVLLSSVDDGIRPVLIHMISRALKPVIR